jgi:DNA-binding transcriptional regulator YdaS (Cro superfamily)
MSDFKTIKKAIDFFGGQRRLAHALKISQPKISQWLHGHKTIPIKHALRIEVLTNGECKAKDLSLALNELLKK